ncbi:myogenesis-regulating glycosidase [Chiloscyllium plagiosum]|uniref:myogenesis-regulating glycosidase n=1 Tax=Chiloscyllium plagiosum TaxID=36176 RepID=UPI001CB81E34|nr:myogenesis-regulating glycosidase [Chiloscyllium plagiosum]
MLHSYRRDQLQRRAGRGENSQVDAMYQVVPGNLPAAREKQSKEVKPLICTILLGLLLVIAAVVAWCYYTASLKKLNSFKIDQLELYKDGFFIKNTANMVLFEMGFKSAPIDLESCFQDEAGNEVNCTKSGEEKVDFFVKAFKPKDTITCYNIEWKTVILDSVVEHCMHWADGHWYGGAETSTQHWPIKISGVMDPKPYVTGDVYSIRDGFGGILERYWISSKSVAVRVNDSVPLHIGWNSSDKEAFCLHARYKDSPFQPTTGQQPFVELSYQVCIGSDLKIIHRYMAKKHFRKPEITPSEFMFRYPKWSTWALFKTEVNQDKVLRYAEKIKKYQFNFSHIEIDDQYSSSYGEFNFDPVKFPNASELLQKLRDDGFQVTLWVHPFVNYNSPSFIKGVENSYFVMDPSGRFPAFVEWWNGIAAVLDFTNPETTDWFQKKLEYLRSKYGIVSFKFDAGETSYLPAKFSTHKPLSDPSLFSKLYAKIAASYCMLAEVRVGYHTQNLPCFVRMIDRDSVWGYELGLKSLIPTVLTMGILGYPFILPDMIGGNVYPNKTDGLDEIPDRELYIRWLELSAFLPAMQFSIPPWLYDEEVLKIAHKFTQLRESLVMPLMLRLAEETTKTGNPIIRPLWWIAPNDKVAQKVDTQFLIGDYLMVAPILEKGKEARDIYLPDGKWQSFNGDLFDKTPNLLTDFAVDLDEVAYFIRMI